MFLLVSADTSGTKSLHTRIRRRRSHMSTVDRRQPTCSGIVPALSKEQSVWRSRILEKNVPPCLCRSFVNYSEQSPCVLPSRREIVSHRAAIAFQSDLSRAELEWFTESTRILGAPTNRFALIWVKSSNGKWLKTAFEKKTPTYRYFARKCSWRNNVLSSSRHLVTPFDLHTFLGWFGSLSIAGGWRKCGTFFVKL